MSNNSSYNINLKDTQRGDNCMINRDKGIIDGNLNLNFKNGINFENNKMLSSLLNDRDMFNKLSNGNDIEIDLSKKVDNNFDIDKFSRNNLQILNNKKNLINNPYIYEKKDTKVNFLGSEEKIESFQYLNDSYNELDTDNNYNNYNSLNNGLNNELNKNLSNDFNIKEKAKMDIDIDIVEKDISLYEYNIEKMKKKDIIISITSPFMISYMWKSLILLSKNPSTEKLLELLGIKKKEIIINDMKDVSYLIKNYGTIRYILPKNHGGTVNTNFINKLDEIFNIKVFEYNDKNDNENSEISFLENISCNNIKLILDFNYNLQFPQYYNPKIINEILLGYNKNTKIKFIELENVQASLITIEPDVVCLEIILGNSILGFYYNKTGNLLDKLDYDLLIKDKEYNILISKIIFPKFNRNKKNSYDKKFMENIKKVHLGEIVYGSIIELDINMNMNLEITMLNILNKPKFDIKQNIEYIKLNHKFYFYIKDINIKNKIICSGLINYM